MARVIGGFLGGCGGNGKGDDEKAANGVMAAVEDRIKTSAAFNGGCNCDDEEEGTGEEVVEEDGDGRGGSGGGGPVGGG
uniref:Uncharacterized protein n=1 Tax=Panagrolaimus sp. PS1159 TaxID=55785 RepID=A0AC35FX59_9BILA